MTRSVVTRGGVAIVGALALALGSSLTWSASAADGSAEAERPAASTATSLPAPDLGYAMPKIPVWVEVGDRGLGGVTVSVRDAKGKTRVTARTNKSGVVLIPRTFVRLGLQGVPSGG